MYLAKFNTDRCEWLTSALQWQVAAGSVMPGTWTRKVLSMVGVDMALRLSAKERTMRALLLLSTTSAGEAELRHACDTLLEAPHAPKCIVPANAEEFDALVGGVPVWQARVDHDLYRHGSQAISCPFRLYATLAGRPDRSEWMYQLHLRSYRPGLDISRRTRKYFARLDVEQPFTDPVREMQRALASRLLEPGWEMAEFIAFGDATVGASWHRGVDEQFRQSLGSMGFADAPVETGDFSDWLMTGIHPAMDDTVDERNLPGVGATLAGKEEVAWLMTGTFARPRESSSSPISAAPEIFISYASEDYARAVAICGALEESGFICWIAPRDINTRAMPYPEAIALAMSEVRVVIVLVSSNASESMHIPRELDLALGHGLPLIPVRLDPEPPRGQLDYLLRTCQWLDGFGRDFASTTGELLRRLRSLPGWAGKD